MQQTQSWPNHGLGVGSGEKHLLLLPIHKFRHVRRPLQLFRLSNHDSYILHVSTSKCKKKKIEERLLGHNLLLGVSFKRHFFEVLYFQKYKQVSLSLKARYTILENIM